MPKAPKSPGAGVQQRHNPLAEEYAPSDPWKQKPAKRQKRNQDDKDDEQNFVDSKSSRKILDIGRLLEEEDERESRTRSQEGASRAFDFESRMGEDDVEVEEVAHIEDDDEAWGEDDDEVEEVEIDANDLAAWNKFIPTDENPIVWPGQETQPSGPGTDLAALILEKIAAHEASDGAVKHPQIMGGGDPEDAVELPAKVVEGTSYPSNSYNTNILIHCSLLQNRPHNVPLQIRQTPQALQNPPHNPRLGNPPLHHTSRELDAQRYVRGNPHLHLRKAANRTDIPQHGSPALCAR